MQVNVMEEDFVPITFRIVIESEAEARAMFAIFNLTDNVNLLSTGSAESIRNCLSEYRTTRSEEVIANNILHATFYMGKKT